MPEIIARRSAKPVVLNSIDDRQLRMLSNRKRTDVRVQMRAHFVPLTAAGMSDIHVAVNLLTDRRVAARWRARLLALGAESLVDDATPLGCPRMVLRSANSASQVTKRC